MEHCGGQPAAIGCDGHSSDPVGVTGEHSPGPPWQTVYWYFNRWELYKVTEQILPVVREQLRIAEGHNPQPSAGADRLRR